MEFSIDSLVLKETLAGLKTFEDSINEGKITVDGDIGDAKTFLSLFDPYVQAASLLTSLGLRIKFTNYLELQFSCFLR